MAGAMTLRGLEDLRLMAYRIVLEVWTRLRPTPEARAAGRGAKAGTSDGGDGGAAPPPSLRPPPLDRPRRAPPRGPRGAPNRPPLALHGVRRPLWVGLRPLRRTSG
mmetsp:Transcript_28463/g.56932  ORF Transcript_28463/g.56932 Transcript_28463/m.56932 type:complete len:106 (+) Transcript_28463:459-776(+)